jgi:hypothetical protein
MSGVYTNLAKKRIEQSQEASHASQKATRPQQPESSISEPKNQSVDQQARLQENPISKPSSSKTQQQKEEKQILHDTMIPRHHDTTIPFNHDAMTPSHDDGIFELVRKSVKQIGKEAATHRFTLDEKNELADIEYTYKRQGIRTSENEITRIAINYFIEDYRQNGEQSLLAKILKRLNS